MRSDAPVLGELDGGSLEVAAVLLEFGLEAGEEGERIGGRAREAGQDPVVVQPPDLAGLLLDDGVAEGDLAVAGHHGLAVVADGEDGGCVKHGAKTAKKSVYQRGRSCTPAGQFGRPRPKKALNLGVRIRGKSVAESGCVQPGLATAEPGGAHMKVRNLRLGIVVAGFTLAAAPGIRARARRTAAAARRRRGRSSQRRRRPEQRRRGGAAAAAAAAASGGGGGGRAAAAPAARAAAAVDSARRPAAARHRRSARRRRVARRGTATASAAVCRTRRWPASDAAIVRSERRRQRRQRGQRAAAVAIVRRRIVGGVGRRARGRDRASSRRAQRAGTRTRPAPRAERRRGQQLDRRARSADVEPSARRSAGDRHRGRARRSASADATAAATAAAATTTTTIRYGYGYYGYGPYCGYYGYGTATTRTDSGLGYGLYSGFGWAPYFGDPVGDPYGTGGYGGYSSGHLQHPRAGQPEAEGQAAHREGLRRRLLRRHWSIEFDGAFQKLALNTGRHKVEVKADGFETAEFDVLITPEQTVTFQGELKRIQ